MLFSWCQSAGDEQMKQGAIWQAGKHVAENLPQQHELAEACERCRRFTGLRAKKSPGDEARA